MLIHIPCKKTIIPDGSKYVGNIPKPNTKSNKLSKCKIHVGLYHKMSYKRLAGP